MHGATAKPTPTTTRDLPNNNDQPDFCVLFPVHQIYREALEYHKYRIIRRSNKYIYRIVGKIGKRQTKIKVQMDMQEIDPDERYTSWHEYAPT